MESLKAFFVEFSFTSIMGIVLYWMPLCVCAFGYFLRTLRNYRNDIAEREQAAKK